MSFTGNPNDLQAVMQFYNTDANTARMIQDALRAQRALSPDIVQQLNTLYADTQNNGGSGYNPLSTKIPRYDAPDGNSYWQTFSDYGGNGPTAQNIVKWKTADLANRQSSGEQFDLQGNYNAPAKYSQDKTGMTLAAALAAMGGVAALGYGMAGAAGAAGSGTAGSAGGFIGEGALSGIGAWDGALAGASPWSAGAAGAGEFGNTLLSSSEFGAPGGSVGGAGGFIGEGAASGIPAWDGALSGAAAAGGGSSLLNSLGGMKGLLGPAATLLGAAAGSQQQGGGETTKKMDPRMDPYVYGEGGLLPRAMGLLQQDMSPERRAQWDQMRAAGMGLLSQPPAGNAFDRFYGGGKR